MSDEVIRLSAEDKFSLIDMSSKERLFPHPFTLGNFGDAMAELADQWEFLWDFRASQSFIYNDIRDAYEEAVAYQEIQPIILARPDDYQHIKDSIRSNRAHVVKMRSKVLPAHEFDLSFFTDEAEALPIYLSHEMLDEVTPRKSDESIADSIEDLGFVGTRSDLTEYQEDMKYLEENEIQFSLEQPDRDELEYFNFVQKERGRILRKFLESIGVNSLLTELAIVFDRKRVHVIPYHSFSLHNASACRDQVVLIRPGRRSATYWGRFRKDILTLEALLNDPKVKEHEIETLLRKNPLFLRGLNYRKVYPQVILPLGTDNSLRPDVIAEPVDSEWCHIIDYKLPSQKVLVGRDNRLSLAAGIIEVSSQLREYSSYFDDRAIAKVVEQKYGFKCYRPKLVAIVGRDPQDLEPEQVRRAMTAFPDLEVVTYDGLLERVMNSTKNGGRPCEASGC